MRASALPARHTRDVTQRAGNGRWERASRSANRRRRARVHGRGVLARVWDQLRARFSLGVGTRHPLARAKRSGGQGEESSARRPVRGPRCPLPAPDRTGPDQPWAIRWISARHRTPASSFPGCGDVHRCRSRGWPESRTGVFHPAPSTAVPRSSLKSRHPVGIWLAPPG